MVDFNCNYNNVYENITSDNVLVVGNNIDVETASDGSFEFVITQYETNEITTPVTSNSQMHVGSDLFFLLSMESPISSLTYAIEG